MSQILKPLDREQLLRALAYFTPAGFGRAVADLADAKQCKLMPQEAACIKAGACQKRLDDFCMGRAAAHRALANINADRGPVLKSDSGLPLWPQGFIGSISHKQNAAVALAGPKGSLLGLGLDLEYRADPIGEAVARRICLAEELAWVSADKALFHQRTRMLFSAKESVYKAFFAAFGAKPGFLDIALAWDEAKSAFFGRIMRPLTACPNAESLDLLVPCAL
ncbi:MAG: 4'-phosphopantetheinyl transferase superfamily protein, partial [Desulfatibacillaceae bacterium]|nr:4'-phosphopantetheinyl transferase superfamily protein [Desulfatibacillaceae bacterium]